MTSAWTWHGSGWRRRLTRLAMHRSEHDKVIKASRATGERTIQVALAEIKILRKNVYVQRKMRTLKEVRQAQPNPTQRSAADASLLCRNRKKCRSARVARRRLRTSGDAWKTASTALC